jgi:hypothetical protein
MDSHRKRSTLHRLSVVCPMNVNHEARLPRAYHPGMGMNEIGIAAAVTVSTLFQSVYYVGVR